MLVQPTKALHFEDVPRPASASFTLREFDWPRFPFNWHYHPELELTLIVKGRGLRFVGDSAEEFTAGDLCLLGTNIPHCWASHLRGASGVRSLVLQFQPAGWGDGFLGLPELRPLANLFEKARRGLSIRGASRRAVGGMILELSRQPVGSLRRLATLLTMLERIAQSEEALPLASASYAPPDRLGQNQRLGSVLGYIHAHLGPELAQHEVARAAGMSPEAFSQFFRRAMGKPYVDYVNELKVQRACRALIESDLRITEVALEAGFNNLSHFNAQFRRFKRTAPRQFRRKAREAAVEEVLATSNDWLGQFK